MHISDRYHLPLLLILLIVFSTETSKAKRPDKRLKNKCKGTTYSRETMNYPAWKEQTIVCQLLKNYNANIRPLPAKGKHIDPGPVVVVISMNIRSISRVSDADMEFVAQFRFQQEWMDSRLAFSDRAEYRSFDMITIATDQSVWIPDTFFQNEKDGWYHLLDQENKLIKIRSDGKIIYNRRLTLTLSCNFDLLRYPMDTQECLIDFASYAYTTDDIVYVWDRRPIAVHSDANLVLPNFHILSYQNSTCHSVTNTGNYSCLRVRLQLERVFSFFLLQLYIPSSMLVAVSWVSYWIDWKSTAARVPLAIVTLLTIITQAHAVNSNLPPVSYTKAIDVWIGACVVFIFASLIEYAIVNYTGIQEQHRMSKRIAARKRRLSDVWEGEMEMSNRQPVSASQFPSMSSDKSPQRSTVRRRRKRRKQEMSVYSGVGDWNETGQWMHHPEPDWTVHDMTAALRLDNSRKHVELLRWCKVLADRGRAERIDMVARVFFPTAFILFNFAYWSIYLKL